jgi:hypothetical protein
MNASTWNAAGERATGRGARNRRLYLGTATLLGVIAFAAIGMATYAHAQQSLKAGEYLVTIATELPGSDAPVATDTTHCVTPEEARDLRSWQSLLLEQTSGDDECSFSDIVTADSTLTWTTVCDDTTATTALSVRGDGFDALVRIRAEGQDFTARVTARWAGATCSAEDAP